MKFESPMTRSSQKVNIFILCLGFDGTTCENDINECEHATCPEGKVCKDMVNNYECRCPDGFTGDNCSLLVDPCAKMFCQNGGTCVVHGHTPSCSCDEGFTGNKI